MRKYGCENPSGFDLLEQGAGGRRVSKAVREEIGGSAGWEMRFGRRSSSRGWSTALFGTKIDQASAACYGNNAQDRRNKECVVFCSVDLYCTNIYNFLLARISESSVDKRCNPEND